MEDFSIEVLKKQASKGLTALIFRKFFLQFIQTFSTVILARILFPKAFGEITILIFLIEFLAVLPSQGFSTAIIQKKTKLLKGELSTVFWLIILSAFLIIALLWFAAPLINNFYKGAIEDGIFLIRLSSFAVLAINVRSIPSAILERQIKYKVLALIEVSEALVAQIISISLVFAGLGVKGLVIGYLSGKIFAAIAFFASSNFLTFKFSVEKIKQFLPFAFNSQIYYLTYSISGAVTPIYVGSVLGTTQVGYLSWAGSVGLIPWSISELIGRVSFPVFSRVQKDQELFGRVMERSFDFLTMVTMPICVIIFVFARDITGLIYSDQWLPAVSALRLFVILGGLQSAIFLCTMALLGLGQVKFIRNITLLSGAIFWILAFILVPKLGFSGLPLAWLLGTSFQLLMVFKVKTLIKVNYWRRFFVYLFLSAVSAIPVYFLITVTGLFSLFLVFSLSLLIYLGLLFIFRRENLRFLWNQWVSVFDSTWAFQFVVKMLR